MLDRIKEGVLKEAPLSAIYITGQAYWVPIVKMLFAGSAEIHYTEMISLRQAQVNALCS